jgi:uncharacterized phiE125 gp8 family phage protein
MIAPELVTPPAALLSLEEAALHLRVDASEEANLITGLIAAAVGWMDGWRGVLGRCIMPQTWAIRTCALQSLRLPFPDVRSAVVSYLDPAGDPQTVDAADYRVRTINGAGHLTFASDYSAPDLLADRDDAVTISAEYGFAEPPQPLKVAALMLVGHWYQHREAVVVGTITAEVPMAVNALIAPYRVGLV